MTGQGEGHLHRGMHIADHHLYLVRVKGRLAASYRVGLLRSEVRSDRAPWIASEVAIPPSPYVYRTFLIEENAGACGGLLS